MSFCFERFKSEYIRQFLFFFFFFGGGGGWGGVGNRVKSRKNSVTGLIPSHFMILYSNRYHMTETSVLSIRIVCATILSSNVYM